MSSQERGEGEERRAVQVSPDVVEEHAGAVDAAVAALRYGSVNINVASMLGFCIPRITWGAFPGNPVQARPRLRSTLVGSTR